MALMYSYLMATRKIALPTSSDSLISEDSDEIDRVLDDMVQLLTKEKNFIKDVHNTAIEFIHEKEEEIKIQQEERRVIEAEQAKKLAKARMITKL